MPVFQTGAELGQGSGEDRLAVFHLQVAVAAAFPFADAPGAQQVDEVGRPVVLGEGHGDLIGFAVAVGVALLDGLADFVELFGGGGHFQSQLVQPGLVDELDAFALVVGVGEVADGQGVDVAIHLGDHVDQLRILLEHLHQVGGVFLGQILVERNEHRQVADDLGLGQKRQERVRQVAGSQHDIDLFAGGSGVQLVVVDLDAGGLLGVLGADLVGGAAALVQAVQVDGDGELFAFRHCGQGN